MIETALQEYLQDNLAYDVVWGQVDPDTDWGNGDISINILKVDQDTVPEMPVYLDRFQISTRTRYIDTAQGICNEIIDLLHGFNGYMGAYLVHVTNASCIGQLQEDANIVHVPAAVALKYTGL